MRKIIFNGTAQGAATWSVRSEIPIYATSKNPSIIKWNGLRIELNFNEENYLCMCLLLRDMQKVGNFLLGRMPDISDKDINAFPTAFWRGRDVHETVPSEPPACDQIELIQTLATNDEPLEIIHSQRDKFRVFLTREEEKECVKLIPKSVYDDSYPLEMKLRSIISSKDVRLKRYDWLNQDDWSELFMLQHGVTKKWLFQYQESVKWDTRDSDRKRVVAHNNKKYLCHYCISSLLFAASLFCVTTNYYYYLLYYTSVWAFVLSTLQFAMGIYWLFSTFAVAISISLFSQKRYIVAKIVSKIIFMFALIALLMLIFIQEGDNAFFFLKTILASCVISTLLNGLHHRSNNLEKDVSPEQLAKHWWITYISACATYSIPMLYLLFYGGICAPFIEGLFVQIRTLAIWYCITPPMLLLLGGVMLPLTQMSSYTCVKNITQWLIPVVIASTFIWSFCHVYNWDVFVHAVTNSILHLIFFGICAYYTWVGIVTGIHRYWKK